MMNRDLSKPKSISAFFHFNEPESLGNVVIIHTLSFLSGHFDLTIYTNHADFLQKQLPQVHIISLENIKLKSSSVKNILAYCRRIARILDSDESDAVFIGHNYSPVALYLKKTCFQYVYQVHEMIGLEKLSGFNKLVQNLHEYFIIRGIKSSKANFVVSEPIMEYLRSNKCYNIYLAPHCVNPEKFQNPLLSEFHNCIIQKKKLGYFIVCYTGCVSEKRGLSLMLESLKNSIVKDPKILFVIAGSDDKNSKAIKSYFDSEKLDENLLCLGKIGYEHIPGVIGLSDVCLSFLEDNRVYQMSPPQKVIEYLSSGKPVIANGIRTHSMLISNEYNGFLTDSDPVKIAEKILLLKCYPSIYKTMSENALQSATRFDTAIVYEQFINVMNDILYHRHNAENIKPAIVLSKKALAG